MSKLLPNATLSSCESEYVALSVAGQEASYLRHLQLEIKGARAVPRTIRILMDSQPEIDILNNPRYHPRTKKNLSQSLRERQGVQ